MATINPPMTWKHGFMEPSETATWALQGHYSTEKGEKSHYVVPPFEEHLSSTVHNSLGLNAARTWPTLHNGTESPQGVPDGWHPPKQVDVLICGGKKTLIWDAIGETNIWPLAGPFGLALAMSLARQGVTFRIIGNRTLAQLIRSVVGESVDDA